MEVNVSPRTPLVGQPVTISGTTGFEQRANSVTIVVRQPGGKQSKPTAATVNAQGAFTFQFKDTKAVGQYTVEVTGPKGKGKGSAQFQVVSLPGLADQLDAAFRAIDKRADQLTGTAKQSAQSLPASPERDEFLKKIVAIESRAQTVNLPPVAIIGQLRRVVQGPQVVYLPDQVVIGKLQQSLEGMQDAVDQIDRAGVIGRRSDSICETINTAIEGAKFAGVAFNVAQTALATLQAVFIDKGIGSFVQQSMGEGADALAVSSGLKTAASGLTVELGALKSLPGLVLDFIEYGSKQVFNAHCVRIQGPMRVRMLMTWNEGVQPWLRYGVRLEGRLTLRYEKHAAPGGAQPVTGEFEGSATRFTFWENIFVVEPLPRGITPLGRHWLAPPGVPAAVEWPVDFGVDPAFGYSLFIQHSRHGSTERHATAAAHRAGARGLHLAGPQSTAARGVQRADAGLPHVLVSHREGAVDRAEGIRGFSAAAGAEGRGWQSLHRRVPASPPRDQEKA